jgi:restriction system protein
MLAKLNPELIMPSSNNCWNMLFRTQIPVGDEMKSDEMDVAGYIPLVVSALRSFSGSAQTSAVREWIESYLNEHGKTMDSILPSGEPKLNNDIRWARYYLVNSGHLAPAAESGRGVWKLTPKGFKEELTPEFGLKVKTISVGLKKAPKEEQTPAPEIDAPPASDTLHIPWDTRLQNLLIKMPDKGFERLCAFLMTRNGLLASKVTGQTGDGGVDGEGMLAFDALALIKTPVAWQCKRFEANKVTSKAVRDFRGAIDGRAKYGLIFTTSSFTADAEKEARRPGATPIELVGLDRLVEMLRDRGIGIKEKIVRVHELEESFFDEYMNPAFATA